MKAKIVALLLAGAPLAACVSTEAVSPNVELINRPVMGATAEAELGDTILEKGRLSTYDGLLLRNQLSWGDSVILKKFTIPPGRLRARIQDGQHVYYTSDRMTSTDALLGTTPYPAGGLCTPKGTIAPVKMFIRAGACTMNPNHKPDVEAVKITDLDAPGLRRELIYNGRSGDTIKFLYREFAGDYARPPFSQDVQYDLKDGNDIGFKGARIHIVSATNTKLSYVVLASFPDA